MTDGLGRALDARAWLHEQAFGFFDAQPLQQHQREYARVGLHPPHQRGADPKGSGDAIEFVPFPQAMPKPVADLGCEVADRRTLQARVDKRTLIDSRA